LRTISRIEITTTPGLGRRVRDDRYLAAETQVPTRALPITQHYKFKYKGLVQEGTSSPLQLSPKKKLVGTFKVVWLERDSRCGKRTVDEESWFIRPSILYTYEIREGYAT
jgi:hypothetical protein